MNLGLLWTVGIWIQFHQDDHKIDQLAVNIYINTYTENVFGVNSEIFSSWYDSRKYESHTSMSSHFPCQTSFPRRWPMSAMYNWNHRIVRNTHKRYSKQYRWRGNNWVVWDYLLMCASLGVGKTFEKPNLYQNWPALFMANTNSIKSVHIQTVYKANMIEPNVGEQRLLFQKELHMSQVLLKKVVVWKIDLFGYKYVCYYRIDFYRIIQPSR